jgi:hypothetical protein
MGVLVDEGLGEADHGRDGAPARQGDGTNGQNRRAEWVERIDRVDRRKGRSYGELT